VENEFEDDFNSLDLETEVGQEFGMVSLNKLSSPISETKAKNMESTDTPLLNIEIGSADGRLGLDSDADDLMSKNSVNIFTSKKTSPSQTLLSSRVEKLASG